MPPNRYARFQLLRFLVPPGSLHGRQARNGVTSLMTCPKKSSYDQHLQKEQKNSITSDIIASDASSNVCSKYCFSASKRTVFWFRLSNQQSSLIADFCQNVSRSPITFPDPCTLSHFIFAWIREHFFVVQSSPRVATRTPTIIVSGISMGSGLSNLEKAPKLKHAEKLLL